MVELAHTKSDGLAKPLCQGSKRQTFPVFGFPLGLPFNARQHSCPQALGA